MSDDLKIQLIASAMDPVALMAEISRLRAENARLGQIVLDIGLELEKVQNDLQLHQSALKEARVALDKMRTPLETPEEIDIWLSECDKAMTTINKVLKGEIRSECEQSCTERELKEQDESWPLVKALRDAGVTFNKVLGGEK